MKLRLTVIVCIVLLTNLAVAEERPELKTQNDKASYAIGLDMGKSLKKLELEPNFDALLRGIKDAVADSKPLMTEQEIQEAITSMHMNRQAKHQERAKIAGEKNKKDGESFLAENKKKDGVITLASGLQYKIIKNGKGKLPKATDSVTANSRGTLIDGTEFDSSFKRGKPITFLVNGVIPGWTEALQLMKEGSKWQLVIPSNLAYGERGDGGRIAPNATLIFEVELISINKQEPHK